ncbi:EamA family transporter [Ramlibacter sp. XY19]|uniref:EamA family transporter n=1 Tax=Ramlibacter paludis TaxID=2908000 RepID=UPI0023DC1F27|nr:EamA family transporter [Ramlibacter paludis]MCG2591699.1 EamA family transporter [Ramlibacter paludis]
MQAAPQLKPRDILAILVVVLVWGMNFVVMKVGLASFTPFQMGAGRFVFAFLPLALLVPRPSVRARWVLAFGLTQGLGQFGFLFVALHVGMTAALASVLMQTQVFFTALLGVLLLHERIGGALKGGMACAALGLACFAANFALAPGSSAVTGWGLVLNLASAASWAASNIVVRKAQQEGSAFEPLSFVAWASAVPILPFLGLSWLLDPPAAQANWLHAPWQAWGALAILGWLATNLAYGLWTGLLKRFPASRVAPFSLGVPLIGLLAGILLLGERVTGLQWLGALLVFCALACVLVGPQLARRRPA